MTVYRTSADLLLCRTDPPPRTCAAPDCGSVLERREDEDPCEFRRRKTCCPEHARQLSRQRLIERNASRKGYIKPQPLRYCPAPNCREPVTRRPGESTAGFNQRQCCSQRCARKLQQQTMARAKGLVEPEHIATTQRRQERRAQYSIDAPDPRQVAAYLAAGERERRLFEPHIAEAARKRAGHADCLAVEGPPARDRASRGMDVAKRAGGAYATDCAEFRE